MRQGRVANQQSVANCNGVYRHHCAYAPIYAPEALSPSRPEALVIRDCGDFTVAL